MNMHNQGTDFVWFYIWKMKKFFVCVYLLVWVFYKELLIIYKYILFCVIFLLVKSYMCMESIFTSVCFIYVYVVSYSFLFLFVFLCMCVHIGIWSSRPQAVVVSGDFCLCMYQNFEYSFIASVNVYIWGLRIEKHRSPLRVYSAMESWKLWWCCFHVFGLLHLASILIWITEVSWNYFKKGIGYEIKTGV
jgi:hypothetical protein